GAGSGIGLGVYGATLPANAWLAQVMDGYADELGLGFTVAAVAPLDASDHVCFSQAGVPAVMFSTLGNHEYYHTPADTIDTILLEDLEAAVWLSWAGLYPVAMGIEDLYPGTKTAEASLFHPAQDLLDVRSRYR
ncbi:MAG TPA: M28 family peptidase, partial [Polyangia bacterium]|nr:M28 family peptidase [Polyangia bacterium]